MGQTQHRRRVIKDQRGRRHVYFDLHLFELDRNKVVMGNKTPTNSYSLTTGNDKFEQQKRALRQKTC